jgi:hypothetical protein
MNQLEIVKKTVEGSEPEERREFLKKVGKSSVAIPAAALLVAASQEKAIANGASGGASASTGGSS